MIGEQKRVDKLGHFPKEKFGRFLRQAGAKTIKELDDTSTENFFREAYKAFLEGKLSLDEFSSVSNRLWLNWTQTHSSTEGKLPSVLLLGGELSYYVRVAHESKDLGNIFVDFLRKINKFNSERT